MALFHIESLENGAEQNEPRLTNLTIALNSAHDLSGILSGGLWFHFVLRITPIEPGHELRRSGDHNLALSRDKGILESVLEIEEAKEKAYYGSVTQ